MEEMLSTELGQDHGFFFLEFHHFISSRANYWLGMETMETGLPSRCVVIALT